MAGTVREEAVKLRNNITNLYEKAIEHATLPLHRSGAIVACEPLEGYPLNVTTEPGATSITRCGKNLGNFKTDISTVTFTNKSGSLVSYYGYEIVLPPGTYTVHAEYVSGTYAGEDYLYGIVVDDNNKAYLNAAGETISVSTVQGITIKTPTFDLPAGCKILIYHGFAYSTINPSTARTLFDRWNVQIELGSKSTPYEPYTCDTFAPGEIIHAISGVNTLWADAGDITVDGRVGALELANSATPAFTETAPAVACEPIEGYPLGLVTTLPASDTGYTKLTLYFSGKNLLQPTATTTTTHGITFTVADDNSITVNGTATDDVFYELGKARLIKGETYTLSGCVAGGSVLKYSIYVSHKNEYYYDYGSGSNIPAVDNVNNTFRILVKSGVTLNNAVFRPMVRLASVTSDAYEKYSEDSTSLTVNFGKTVYGGSYNWITGILTDENGNTTQLTPNEIRANAGVNTLFASAGDITLSCRLDMSNA